MKTWRRRQGIFSPILIVLTAAFSLGCAQSFRHTLDEAPSLSAQCKSAVQSSIRAWLPGDDFDCESASEYRCELRIFSPDVVDGTQVSSECFANGSRAQICIQTETRSFATASARGVAGIAETEFAEGGEFNRSEAKCFHQHTRRGVPIFEGHGERVVAAFAKARDLCRAARAGIL